MNDSRVADLAVLLKDMPDLGLRFGEVGVVRATWPASDLCEVEFHADDPARRVNTLIPAGDIRPAPATPFDPLPSQDRSLYF